MSRHAVATTPVGPQAGSSRSPETCNNGLPHNLAGSAPPSGFSRPARRSRMLRPACSQSRITTLCIEGFRRVVSSTTAPIATGWSDSCRVGLAPTEDAHLFTAHVESSGGAVRLGKPCVLPALSVAGARVSSRTPFPPPAHRTGRADLPHPALGQEVSCVRGREVDQPPLESQQTQRVVQITVPVT